jgi:hypothetical protein
MPSLIQRIAGRYPVTADQIILLCIAKFKTNTPQIISVKWKSFGDYFCAEKQERQRLSCWDVWGNQWVRTLAGRWSL